MAKVYAQILYKEVLIHHAEMSSVTTNLISIRLPHETSLCLIEYLILNDATVDFYENFISVIMNKKHISRIDLLRESKMNQ